MTTRFHSEDAWNRIRELCRMKGPRLVAVPFLGQEATRRLPLKAGDVLVVRLDEGAVKSGQTSPAEIGKFLRRGVEVHAQSNLHAKVFVFGRTAVIGSTNVSTTSEEHLLEAVIETTDARAVADAKDFVRSLCGDAVTPKQAKGLEALYTPPEIQRGGRRPDRKAVRGAGHSFIWAVSLDSDSWTDEDYAAEAAGRPLARKSLKDTRRFTVDSFSWSGSGFGAKVKVGERVLQVVRERSGGKMVEAPFRVIRVLPYGNGASPQVMVYVEKQKELRRLRLSELLKRLGPTGKPLQGLAGGVRLRDSTLVYELGRMWSPGSK